MCASARRCTRAGVYNYTNHLHIHTCEMLTGTRHGAYYLAEVLRTAISSPASRAALEVLGCEAADPRVSGTDQDLNSSLSSPQASGGSCSLSPLLKLPDK